MSENYKDLLERLNKAHEDHQQFIRDAFGRRYFDPEESSLYSEAAEAIRALVPQETERPFKVDDKVQEICDDSEEVIPWGLVDEMTSMGYYVRMGNTRYVGRRIFYYDEEIEPYAEEPEALFKVGQKVELLQGYSGNGMVLTAGFVGRVKAEIDGVYEVVFSTQSGTFGMSFTEDVLKAAE